MELVSRARLRVRPRHGEPAAAMMARLAKRNGFASPREFGDCFGVRYDDVRLGRAAPELARLSGLSEDTIAAWSPTFGSPHALALRGQSLRYPHDWSIGESGASDRACPVCLRNDLRGSLVSDGPRAMRPYVRAWWCLRDVTTCPAHGCFLAPRRDAPSNDDAHFWEEWIGIPKRRVSADDAAADRYVLGRLGVLEPVRVSILDDLPLGDASAVITWLGELATTGTTPVDVRTMPFDEAAGVRSAGLRLAGEWPLRIHARLDWIAEEAPSSARGLKGVYGRFYSRLYDDRANRNSHPGRELLKRVVEYHALGRFPFDAGETIFRKPADNSVRVTLAHAASICGVDAETMDALVEAFGLAPGTDDGGQRDGVERQALESARDMLACSLGSDETAAALGIDMAELAQLRSYGVLRPMLDRGDPSLDRYDRGTVELPMSWISMNVGGDDGSAADAHAPNEIADRTGLTFAEVVNALMLGNLRCVGFADGAAGLHSVLASVPDGLEDLGYLRLDPILESSV